MGSFLMGRKGTDAKVQDTTATQYQGLRTPLAGALQQQLNSQGYQGPYAAQLGAGETAGINGVQQAANGVGGMNAGTMALMQQARGQMNPFAQMSGLEQYGVNNIAGQAFGQNPMLMQASNQAFMPNQLQGATNTALQGIVSGQNPMTDQLIASAQRPILDNFSDQALAQRGLYTGAGQQIQGDGSSPFAMASARLAGSTQNALNDASLGVTNQAFQQQLQGLGLAQNQQQLGYQGAQTADSLANNAIARAQQGLTAAGTGATRQSAAYENAANRQVQAGGELGQQTTANQMAQLQAQLQNLQAQGLPRSVQQLGIDAGLTQYNAQQQQMLQLMQLMGGLSQAGSQVIPGRAAETGALQSGLNSFLGGVGSSVGASDRRAKKHITPIGTTPNGLPVYNFRYLWDADDAPVHTGVMADEIEPIIPDAVIRNAQGLAYVDYNKVRAHG